MRLVSDAEAKRGLFSPPALPVIPEGEDLYTCLTQREATCPSCNKRGKLEVELDGRRISRVSCGFCEYQMFKPATRNEKYFRLFGVLTMGALAVYFWPSSEATQYATQDAGGDYVGALMSYAVLTLPSCLMASWSLGLILGYLKRRGDGLMVAAKAVGLEFK